MCKIMKTGRSKKCAEFKGTNEIECGKCIRQLICQYTSEGYINAYDKMPDHDCDVNVIDHNGDRFKARCEYNKFGKMGFSGKSKGYDICWWKEITR